MRNKNRIIKITTKTKLFFPELGKALGTGPEGPAWWEPACPAPHPTWRSRAPRGRTSHHLGDAWTSAWTQHGPGAWTPAPPHTETWGCGWLRGELKRMTVTWGCVATEKLVLESTPRFPELDHYSVKGKDQNALCPPATQHLPLSWSAGGHVCGTPEDPTRTGTRPPTPAPRQPHTEPLEAGPTHPSCSWWQTTEASASSQWLLQTVPQPPGARTSTVPSDSLLPPRSRTDPGVEKNPKPFNSKESPERPNRASRTRPHRAGRGPVRTLRCSPHILLSLNEMSAGLNLFFCFSGLFFFW